jgi:hypothetical protein
MIVTGGMYCYDPHSCGRRWSKTRGLMSSQQWSDIRHGKREKKKKKKKVILLIT